MLETALVTRLADLAPNMYPGRAPTNYDTPVVIYNRLSTQMEDDLDGVGDMGWVVMQIDVYEPSYLAAKELAQDIRDHLSIWDDEQVHSVAFVNETDIIDETTEATLYRVMMTFLFFAAI
ncbi:DUF3168 domain-containing protein [Sphingobium yanoikuyae]|uniref:DUF3168 domain-containing protein n=1 Tax=Sphingobium yanoikuyae TaxID=13690 RepID=A0AA42X3W6_SPHYA|nr:DUF3168 domain-containing protein [Sphingobium yanoikuyae]MDH2134929.1 DUF3168 domain-containing protein [Sphingobium yanoikuyae]MDH2152782.1 DUF3168 domain-containing protein [Sphingobium yanoikuyae]MDH2170264.1 DUF3168 domain-containing protein [Sphingobium yanoikuyae]